ncbi:MAG: hypothetical protein ACXWQO_06160 [Bdellovibrionota bacterium]
MRLFRPRTIFHVEDSLPDPEELKLRFRRRILLLTFLGFLIVLAIPVFRDLKGNIEARSEARQFAEWLVETRTQAAVGRLPISVDYDPAIHAWNRIHHAPGENCALEAMGPPEQKISGAVTWKLQVQQETGETLPARHICLHPLLGLLLDGVPMKDGKLLITALPELEAGETEAKPAYLLVTSAGADLQVLTR